MFHFLHVLAITFLLALADGAIASVETAIPSATKNVAGKTYSFCFNPNWKPYDYNDKGTPRGIFMDYIHLLAERMDIQITPHFTPNWSASLEAIREGKCDFLLGAVKTKERETFLDFTQPYYDAVHILIAKKDKPFIGSLNALAGQTICGAKNSVMMQHIARDYPSIKQIAIETTEEALKILQSGKADACVGSLDQVATELGWFFEDSKIIGKLDYPYPISIAVRKDLPELRTAFDQAVSSLSDADRSQIMRRWSFVNIDENIDYAIIWKTIGASALLIGIFFFWNRRLQQEINQRKQAESAKQSFMSMVSHELRTPLNAIIGMSARLNQSELGGRQSEYVKKISHSSELLLMVINDLLDFEKLETGKFEIQQQPFNLHEIIAQVVDIISVATTDRDLKLVVNVETDVPADLIGDGLRLKQILLNLANNATKFTEQGTIEIRVKCANKESSHCDIDFSVRDTGIGISKDNIPSLFTPFFQVDTFLTRRQGGTGLGLPICRQLVELMGGRIWVDSTLGKGSDFQFVLPFEIARQTHQDMATGTRSDMTPPEGLKGRRILLVEDNSLNQQVFLETLTDAGMQVELARNGQDALEKTRLWRPDLILMDIQMPVMDGLEATRQIRMTEGCEHVPIIIMTAHASIEQRIGHDNLIFNDYLTKPIEPGVLYATIARHLDPQDQSAALPTNTPAQPTSLTDGDVSTSMRLPGIDLPSALKMTNGKMDLVMTRLCQFVEDMHDLEEQLRQCQAQSRDEDIRSLIHSLTGSSGNIGATRLHQLTASFLKSTGEQDRSNLIDQIIDEMHLLRKTAEVIRGRQHSQHGRVESNAQVLENLKTLGRMIENHEYVPEDLLGKLEATLHDFDKRVLMQALRHELARFHYESAKTLYKKLCIIEGISDAR